MQQHIDDARAGASTETASAPRSAPASAPVSAVNASVDCGWGRLIFANTFADANDLVDSLLEEAHGSRDVAFYVTDPHVIVSLAPFELFLDPSHAYRLELAGWTPQPAPDGVVIRAPDGDAEFAQINRICAARGMVQVDIAFAAKGGEEGALNYLAAIDADTGAVLGAATGVDHVAAFGDPEGGSSLWCLAVDPQAPRPGVGEALVRGVADMFAARGRSFLDLSVMHDNAQAIALYEKLGFQRLPVFTVKTKSSINERLFVPPMDSNLNPYARIITDEARRRGIIVDVVDAPSAIFRLSLGGRSVLCRESLSSATSAVAMAICDDKALTRRILAQAGLKVPAQCEADVGGVAAIDFLRQHGAVVVKPARGEQGRGIAVNLTSEEEVRRAIEDARRYCETVLVEEFVKGEDLRIVAIDYKVVAAAVRKPAQVIGDGRNDLRALILKQSRRRAAATGGESRIPLDAETERCVRMAGYSLEDVPPRGEQIFVRRTANLHTGGTIHDVTDIVPHELVEAAVAAARAIEIPVVGLDFMVPDLRSGDYRIIEANERPGLANHEPQPTAERFIDMLFPMTAGTRLARKS